jgi:predicted nucleic acid-binding protein
MITAVDTNVIIALWDTDADLNTLAQRALEDELASGGLRVAAPVYAELLAFPGRDARFLDSFFADTGIIIDWDLDQAVWRAAGRAFQNYAARRKKQPGNVPRRILADFLIGAHADENEYTLLTMDTGLYRTAFPRLSIATL